MPFAAAFAVGEETDASGDEFMAATVGAYDVSCRLALALGLSEHSGHGFHPTATCGVFGATAVAARLLGLTADQIVNAFGIAGSQTAGSADTERRVPGRSDYIRAGLRTPALSLQNSLAAASLAHVAYWRVSRAS